MTTAQRSRIPMPPSAPRALPAYAGGGSTGADPNLFMQRYGPIALRWQQQTGIPASVFLSIAASESNYGNNDRNMLFGIVGNNGTDGGWTAGTSAGAATFRAYKTADDAFSDFVKLVSTAPNYASAWANRSDPEKFIAGLVKGGYAGDHNDEDRNWPNLIRSIRTQTVEPLMAKSGIKADGPATIQNNPTGAGVINQTASAPQRPSYAFPVQGYSGQVADHWGEVKGGTDIFAPAGTPVVAMTGGKIVSAGYSEIGGWNVTLQGADGNQYYMAHMRDKPNVQAGQTVQAGAPIGLVGETGNAAGKGAHLHIGIGPEIRSGADKYGGTGGDYDAVGLLRSVQAGKAPASTGGAGVVNAQTGGAAGGGVDQDALKLYNDQLARVQGLQTQIDAIRTKPNPTNVELGQIVTLQNSLESERKMLATYYTLVKPGRQDSPAATTSANASMMNAQTGATTAQANLIGAQSGLQHQGFQENLDSATLQSTIQHNQFTEGLGYAQLQQQMLQDAFGQRRDVATMVYNVLDHNGKEEWNYYQSLVKRGELTLQQANDIVQAHAAQTTAELLRSTKVLEAADFIRKGNIEKYDRLLPQGTTYQIGYEPNSPLNASLAMLGLPPQAIKAAYIDPATIDPATILRQTQQNAGSYGIPDATNPAIAGLEQAGKDIQKMPLYSPQMINTGTENNAATNTIAIPGVSNFDAGVTMPQKYNYGQIAVPGANSYADQLAALGILINPPNQGGGGDTSASPTSLNQPPVGEGNDRANPQQPSTSLSAPPVGEGADRNLTLEQRTQIAASNMPMGIGSVVRQFQAQPVPRPGAEPAPAPVPVTAPAPGPASVPGAAGNDPRYGVPPWAQVPGVPQGIPAGTDRNPANTRQGRRLMPGFWQLPDGSIVADAA